MAIPEFKDKLGFSVSHTTRRPRDGEQNCVHYHFTDQETMEVTRAFIRMRNYGMFPLCVFNL